MKEQMLLEGASAIQEGERLIKEIQQMLYLHLPERERGRIWRLVVDLCNQASRIGSLKQTMEQIKQMETYCYEKESNGQKAETKGIAAQDTCDIYGEQIFYGYAEDQGLI